MSIKKSTKSNDESTKFSQAASWASISKCILTLFRFCIANDMVWNWISFSAGFWRRVDVVNRNDLVYQIINLLKKRNTKVLQTLWLQCEYKYTQNSEWQTYWHFSKHQMRSFNGNYGQRSIVIFAMRCFRWGAFKHRKRLYSSAARIHLARWTEEKRNFDKPLANARMRYQ